MTRFLLFLISSLMMACGSPAKEKATTSQNNQQQTRVEPTYTKDDYEGLMSEGMARFQLKEHLEAILQFTRAIEADSEQPEPYYYRGQIYMELRNFTGARDDFMMVTSMAQHDADAWNFLGSAQAQLGDDAAAVESYNEAIKLSPDNAMYYYNRATSLAKLNKLSEALDDFDTTINMGTQTSAIFNNRANARFMLGDYRGAISDYTRALSMNPDNPAPLANRGISYMNIGDSARACNDWRKAEELGYALGTRFLQMYCGGK